jgi:tRNA dimethylallyltransferase
MADRAKSDCLVITGATATGKTAVAIAVAQRIGGEIISLDSRQIYRRMDIGTAKATPQQRAEVPHHGLDLLNPSERYSAGRYAEDARRWMHDIQKRGRVPVFVGGTGFFLRALTQPLFQEPDVPKQRKEALKRLLNTKSRTELLDWLRHLDPEGATQLTSEAGRQRIARMIEIVLLTGRSLRWWHEHEQSAQPGFAPLTIVLELERDTLYDRINARVAEMVNQGLVEEVQQLVAQGYDEQSPGLKTTGYKELIPHLRGACSLPVAVDAIQRASRAYARRQVTWFRHQLSEPVLRIDAGLPQSEIVETIVTEWRRSNAYRN